MNYFTNQEPNRKPGMRRDGKKSSINTASRDAHTVSARFIYGSTTTRDGSAMIHHGGATNRHPHDSKNSTRSLFVREKMAHLKRTQLITLQTKNQTENPRT